MEQFAEHHPDLFARIDGHKPRGLFVVDTSQRRSDLVVEVARRSPGSIAGSSDVLGADGEDVAVFVGGKCPQLQAVARTRRPLPEGEAELFFKVIVIGLFLVCVLLCV
jgi:hypothetical protein